jgi:type I restriction enzyme S subunit
MIKWEVKKLGEVCTLQRGFDLPKDLREKGDYPLISSSGEIDTHCEPKVKSPGIVTGRSGSIGSLFFVEKDFWPLNTTLFVKDFHGNDPRFIFYLLKHFDLGRFASGTGVPTLNRNHVHDEKINITTSLKEQKRIVEILDKAFEGIAQAEANTRRNLINARELFDSYLASIHSDREKLRNLVDIRTGKLNSNAAEENGIYPFFTCSRDVYRINDYAFDCEAILLAGNNASGDFNVKHYSGKFNAYQRTYVITINPEKRVVYRYLYYQLLHSLKEFKQKSVGAATKFLKIGIIQDMEIPLPNIYEQNKIVVNLDSLQTKTQKLETIYQRKLEEIAELKQSILEKAFTGQLSQ